MSFGSVNMRGLLGFTLLSFCFVASIIFVFRESYSISNLSKKYFLPRRPHSMFSKDADGFPNSSSVTETNSTLSLDYVCLQRNESTGMHIYTYSPNADPLVLANGTPPFLDHDRQAYKWAWWPIGKSSSEWEKDRKEFYVPNTTVLLVRIYGSNIAHCLSDLIFEIAPDIDQLWNATPETFLYVDQFDNQGIWGSCVSWCCHAWRHAGIIAKDAKPVYHDSIYNGSQPVCFERLIVPRVGIYRRPPISSNAVQAAREHMLQSLDLDPSPWPNVSGNIPILFYDRRGAGRRIWNNSQTVADTLERKYQTSIRVIGKEWNHLDFKQQASLFHEYPVIIAPHGAHLANLIFGRPQTRVVELVCSEDEAICPAKNWTPSLFTFSWFPSFSRQIPMEHYQLPIHDCNDGGGYSPKTFDVNITTFISCVAQWLELKEQNRNESKIVETGAS